MTDGVIASLPELIALRAQVPKNYPPKTQQGIRSGNHQTFTRGRGMDFSETRNYQAGDDIRHMEWRVTARTGRPHVKIYQEEKERPVILLVDFNPSMVFGTRIAFKSVVAARWAALLAWSFVKQGDRVGGFFFSHAVHSEWMPKSRDSGILPLLNSLSHYTEYALANRTGAAYPLKNALLRLRRVLRPGSLVVLLSDFYTFDAECEKHLKLLRTHNDILAYPICDQLELAVPKPALYPFSDGKLSALVDLRDTGLRKGYQDYCDTRLQQLVRQCHRLQIPSVQVTAETKLPQLLLTVPRRSYG